MVKIKKNNLTLIILSFIMFINALSSGIIIPLLYPYAARFGIDPMGLSLLFVSYSAFQFLATPIIGRLADRFGRKPLLLISIFGTSLSLALFASAQSVFMLFTARILDGVTGGNISVAQAMIADETSGKDRAKGFGILGAMFGMGFLIGPAIGGLMSSISLSAPFWLASALALGTTILGAFILRETLDKTEVKKVKSEPLFNFKSMISALFSPVIGSALLLTFISYFAQQAIIIGFQTFTVDQLKLDATTIGLIFAAVGLVMVFMNMIGLKFVIEKVKSNRKIVTFSFISASILILIASFTKTTPTFVFTMLIYIVSFSLINPVLTSFISKRVNREDQGIILGINQSYASLGQIFGPISAGLISQINTASIFRWGSLLLFIGFLFSSNLGKSAKKTNL